jgi:hypothetical protein
MVCTTRHLSSGRRLAYLARLAFSSLSELYPRLENQCELCKQMQLVTCYCSVSYSLVRVRLNVVNAMLPRNYGVAGDCSEVSRD